MAEKDLFLKSIKIEKLRHLAQISIHISGERLKHIILTGKNGSGKTTVLNQIHDRLKRNIAGNVFKENINKDIANIEKKIEKKKEDREQEILYDQSKKNKLDDEIKKLESQKIEIEDDFQSFENLEIEYNPSSPIAICDAYKNDNFILAFFDDSRSTDIDVNEGILKRIDVSDTMSTKKSKKNEKLAKYFDDYLSEKLNDLRTKKDSDTEYVNKIELWIRTIENHFKEIFESDAFEFKYNEDKYLVEIIIPNREPFKLNELSKGYSSIICIVVEILLRMKSFDKNAWDIPGIVLIDEIETHLHLSLQEKVLPFLISFFPKIQFIVSTHSPSVINSIENAVIYDLENKVTLTDAYLYTYSALAEGFFKVKRDYSKIIQEKLDIYENLLNKENLSVEEKIQVANLNLEISKAAPLLNGVIYEKFRNLSQRIFTENASNN